MTQSIEQIIPLLERHSLKLAIALGILLVGWLVALLISGLARKALAKARIEKFLGKATFFDDMGKSIPVEKWIARAIFYLLMVFVFIAFFEALGMGVINEPLNRFVERIFDYAPKLIPPIILIIFAWVAATFLRFLVVKVMGNRKLHSVLDNKVGLDKDLQSSFVTTLANTVYWVVFLIFSLAILDALQLQGLLGPLQNMFQNILGFLPNIFAAGIIFILGWFLARIVQRIVSNLLVTLGTDRLSDQAGLKSLLGSKSLANLLGLVAYVVVLIPVLIASLNALRLNSITEPASQMLNRILTALPSIFAAVLVLFMAYLIGRLVASLVTNLLEGAGFNDVLAKLGVATNPQDFAALLSRAGVGDQAPNLPDNTPSQIVGKLLMIGILLFASIEALNLIGFTSLALLLTQFTIFGGQVILGLIIFGVGLILSNFVANTIISKPSFQARFFALMARISIIGLASAMALRQMGIANEIINLAFGLILGAVAVAFAISFGIGGRDVAAQLIRDLVKKVQDEPKGPKI